jgi:hypothetical protein
MGFFAPISSESAKHFTRPGRSDPETTEKNKQFWDIVTPGHGLFSGPKAIKAPELSQQEQSIIARMKELAMGDPDLDRLYQDFTLGAVEGREGVSPGLERSLREKESEERERIARGLGSLGDIRATGGIRRMSRLREQANLARESARQDAIRRGEGLLTSRTARQVSAARTALSPLEHQGALESQASQQTAANIAQQKAGIMQLGGQIGSEYDASRRK